MHIFSYLPISTYGMEMCEHVPANAVSFVKEVSPSRLSRLIFGKGC